MKYTNSIFTPNQSGKLGATIFSSNQYGTYECLRKIPVDPKTPAQMNVRAGISTIAREWPKLTNSQRDQWRKAAHRYSFQKKGKTYFLSAHVFFVKLNKNLYEVKEPLLKDFPVKTKVDIQSFDVFSVQIVNTHSGKDMLFILSPAININTKISLFATMPVKTSELYGTRKRYKIGVFDSSFVSGSSIKDIYIAKYGQLPDSASQAYFEYKVTDISTGFSSLPKHCATQGI